MKQFLRPLYFKSLEAMDWGQRLLQGKCHLPPRHLRDVGGGYRLADFEATGVEFVEHFKTLCDLKSDAHILEIGCGSGRIAIPLTEYLGPQGRFYGIEIVEESVRWCVENISARYPNFSFLHADLYNKRYNPHSKQLTKDYVFPFADESFDFIYLTSVFTHLLPEDMENYFKEIARVLNVGGQLFSTFFILDPHQQQLAEQGRNQINFQFDRGKYRLRDEHIPESAVAYQEEYILELYRRYHLTIQTPVLYGRWRGGPSGYSFQDFIIAQKV